MRDELKKFELLSILPVICFAKSLNLSVAGEALETVRENKEKFDVD